MSGGENNGTRGPAGRWERTTVGVAPLLLLSVLLLATDGCGSGQRAVGDPGWHELAPGLELAATGLATPEGGRAVVHLVRLDPRRFVLSLRTASEDSVAVPLTARQWCLREGAVAAINAGMYQTDGVTSVGLLRKRGHVNNPRLGRDRMILLLDPRDPGDPPVRLVDRTCDDYRSLAGRYRAHLQSIRMLGCGRRNVWRPGGKRHSVAAVAIDGRGRVLLILCGDPVDPHLLVERLLRLPIDIRRAMYLEGGPPGQLFLRVGDHRWEFGGRLGGLDIPPPPVPNVILVRARETPHAP